MKCVFVSASYQGRTVFVKLTHMAATVGMKRKPVTCITGNMVEIQTGSLPNATPECYLYSNLLDSVVSSYLSYIWEVRGSYLDRSSTTLTKCVVIFLSPS